MRNWEDPQMEVVASLATASNIDSGKGSDKDVYDTKPS